jgi:lysine-specific demethylase/histidyl-hydroxylase NO66
MKRPNSAESSGGMSRAAQKRRKLKARKNTTKEVERSTNDGTPVDQTNGAEHDIEEPDTSTAGNDADIVDESLLQQCKIKDLISPEDVTFSGPCDLRARALVMAMVLPCTLKSFYADHWQKMLYHAKRQKTNYFSGLLSLKTFHALLNDHIHYFGKDLDVCDYDYKDPENGKSVAVAADQEDDNDDDDELIEAKSSKVLDLYKAGHAVKLNTPHKYRDQLWHFLSLLEQEFESPVGCDAHLIPDRCEGFDVDVTVTDSFFLQLEGASMWTISNTRKEDSSEVSLTLCSGDTLYVPKGYQTKTASSPGQHSLYLDVHTNESVAIEELMQLVVPQALQVMVNQINPKVKAQRFLTYMGAAHAEENENETIDQNIVAKRKKFTKTMQQMMNSLAVEAVQMMDAAADQVAKSFIVNRLPVPLSSEEEEQSAAGNPNQRIQPFTVLRIVRPGIARAVLEDGMVVVYHCMDNVREMYASTLSPLEFELDDGPAIEALLNAYPNGVEVQSIPHPSEELEDKVSVAAAMYKEGFLVVEDAVTKGDPANKENGRDDDDDCPF